ncbi:hypothetical protein GCK32_006720, partial [Trichostrongylus colubriformis]
NVLLPIRRKQEIVSCRARRADTENIYSFHVAQIKAESGLKLIVSWTISTEKGEPLSQNYIKDMKVIQLKKNEKGIYTDGVVVTKSMDGQIDLGKDTSCYSSVYIAKLCGSLCADFPRSGNYCHYRFPDKEKESPCCSKSEATKIQNIEQILK